VKDRSVRKICPSANIKADIHIPPSKSYTNRALIAAALADGPSTILHASESDDSNLLYSGLQEFGARLTRKKDAIHANGLDGKLKAPEKEIYVGNAGTAMRFLSAFAAITPGTTVVTGDQQMQQRPIEDLLAALKMAGVKCTSRDGRPPVTIYGGNFLGGNIDLDASISSQYLSALLLIAPYAKRETTIRVKGHVSSLPYVDMTLHVMRSFGAIFEQIEMKTFIIDARQHYIGHDFPIEADASAATYFIAAAAITGGLVRIPHLSFESLQGDLRFLSIVKEMGCSVTTSESLIEVRGGHLGGIDIDMNAIPDCVPALAVVAAFADGPSVFHNIAHLRYKETDRLAALARELTKIGARVELTDDGMAVHPNAQHGATIETYNDHRIAMGFAVAGLRIPGIVIQNPECVSKSFPTFWKEFEKVEGEN